MALKLKRTVSRSYAEDQKKNGKQTCEPMSKVEALYVALICFTTHCLSSISFEAGSRASFGTTVTKSAPFNALFRRSFNLKIVIFVTNVITGLITTGMMMAGDKYGIPYLYLPWLMDTMRGIALYEGPALLNLASALLPNISFPSGTFVFTTLILYVEELCIWSNAFTNFQRCWNNYHYQKQCAATKIEEKLFVKRKQKILCRDEGENELNVVVEKQKAQQRCDELCGKSNSRSSTNYSIKPVKSAFEGNSNFIKNQLWDVTG